MTTIAANFLTGEMAADSMVSSDDSYYLINKLRRGKGCIYGGAGDFEKLLKFYQVLDQGGDLDSDTDISILMLNAQGLWVYESSVIPVPIKNSFFAIGTGAGYAMGAMHLGKSPREAVEIACLYDTSSHGPIDEMKLERIRGTKKSI